MLNASWTTQRGKTVTHQEAPDLTEEQNTHQASVLSKVNVLCKLCEASAAQMVDEYERTTFEDRLDKARALLAELTDPFYASAGRHFIINSLCKAGRQQEAALLFGGVTDDFIVEKVLEENPTLKYEPSVSASLHFRHIQCSIRMLRNDVRDLVEREPPHLPDKNEELRSFAIELGQQLNGLAELVQSLTKRITIILWVVVAAALIVVFR